MSHYDQIMECDEVTDDAIWQICMSLGLLSAAVQLILSKFNVPRQQQPLEFELLLLLVYAPTSYLLVKVAISLFRSFSCSTVWPHEL